jgi:hypothetical protein
MSACAGSSTDADLQFHLLCPPGKSPVHKSRFFEDLLPARSEWIARPAGQGFMSTQRRESRWQRISCTGRTEESGRTIPGFIARHCCASASGGTAPPGFTASFHPSDKDPSPGAPEWLATKSLQMGYRIVQLVQFVRLVWFVQLDLRHGSPPFGAEPGAETGTPAIYGSSLPHIPSLSGLARLHPILPRVPAG